MKIVQELAYPYHLNALPRPFHSTQGLRIGGLAHHGDDEAHLSAKDRITSWQMRSTEIDCQKPPPNCCRSIHWTNLEL